MPRRACLMLANVAVHLIQRGNNRQACFYQDSDYLTYLDWLYEYAQESACRIHSYVLMTNHVHLLLTPAKAEGPGKLMKRLGQRYVQYVNRTYQRSGTLWEGRYKSCLTNEESYVLGCYRYIELNPIRAGMVKHPGEYRWSSFRVNAQNEPTQLISPHQVYQTLGKDTEGRAFAYRELFRHHLEPGLVDEIRQATTGNYVVGSGQFKSEIAAALGRRVTRGNPGRPAKSNPEPGS